ncbi:hypothetical protein OEZ49_22480 [Ruegeria sp. WL0004]|uniref:Calcium-binding protein n=1 Tax=Ruegeria marisflavi TaxID=2984152 RepID=A0ABT2WXA1_9RHOB|nr:calcium-binding protein [Ruegeria sp. WL0004]MCU9840519.1 hypothetical protein [Ruegeria sp. WL0004]
MIEIGRHLNWVLYSDFGVSIDEGTVDSGFQGVGPSITFTVEQTSIERFYAYIRIEKVTSGDSGSYSDFWQLPYRYVVPGGEPATNYDVSSGLSWRSDNSQDSATFFVNSDMIWEGTERFRVTVYESNPGIHGTGNALVFADFYIDDDDLQFEIPETPSFLYWAFGDEIQVTGPLDYRYETSQASVASLTNGGFVVTWARLDMSDFQWEVLGQRYDNSWSAVDSQFQIIRFSSEAGPNQSLIGLSEGGFVVVWQSSLQDGDGMGVFGQRYDASGNKIGVEFQVNNYTDGDQTNPAVNELSEGGFVVVWQSSLQDGDGMGVFGQRYDASGNKAGAEFQVNNYAVDDQEDPAIIGLVGGGFVAIWESKDNVTYNSEIKARIFDSEGTPIGDEFQVNSPTDYEDKYPSVASLSDGGFIATWSDMSDLLNWDVLGQRYDEVGNPIGTEFRVNSHIESDQFNSNVTGLSDGGFLVTWISNGQDGDGGGVFGQRFDADGNASGLEFRINKHTAFNQIQPSLAELSNQDLVVVWSSQEIDQIAGQRLVLSLTGTSADDVLNGGPDEDVILGFEASDRLVGDAGNDSLDGGLGADTLNGGDGHDIIIGGPSDDDLRDVIYAGEGNDSIDAGAGNDLVYGQGGNDTIAGGFGVDELQGQDGDDVITGSAFSDLVFGGAGNDFVNGGFGHDRINGGSGADKFFHVGVEGHGSDWVQDYNAAEGDVLLFGNSSANRGQFQVNFAHTENAEGERSGDDTVMEAFVIFRPTGQIMWALVDGEAQSSINLQIGSDVVDLLA